MRKYPGYELSNPKRKETMTITPLEELLQKRHDAESSSSDHIDWEGRKTAWVERVNGLFQDIIGWLRPDRKSVV